MANKKQKPDKILCSVWDGTQDWVGSNLTRIDSLTMETAAGLSNRKKVFIQAREWAQAQWYIRAITLLRAGFYNYGITIVPGSKVTKKAARDWELNCRNMYQTYARDAWWEWLAQDNVIGIWGNSGHPPQIWQPSRCEYSDTFGYQRLEIKHGISPENIAKLKGLSSSERQQLTEKPGGIMVLDKTSNPWRFDVAKRSAVGNGLAIPGIAGLFDCAAQLQSLEVGDAGLAQAGRRVLEQHKMGHEIKSGLLAGSEKHFWDPTRAKNFENKMKGKTGHVNITTNFDHEVVWPRPDPKYFAWNRYEAGNERIAIWSMPLGQILFNKNINPFLMQVLKVQADYERGCLRNHLRTIFVEALGAPKDITVAWSDECFLDTRIAAEMIKFGLQAGPLSQGSFLEAIGKNQETEHERKEAEQKLPESHTHPLFDSAHGKPKNAPGPKPGSRNQR